MHADNMDFNGYFKIDAIDNDGNIVDSYEDKNMIMTDARTSMSEIFANLPTSTFIERFSLGTMGHVGTDVLSPKIDTDGFTNVRDRMFSESGSTAGSPTQINDILPVVNLGDVYYINATVPGFYSYLGANTTNYTVVQADVDNVAVWESLGTTAPYTYDVNFTIPGTAVDLVNGDPATGITETDAGAGTTVNVLRTGTSLELTFNIPTAAANSQNTTYSSFTEASLQCNGRIFSLKTFKVKLKDATISLRITWRITF